MTINELEPNRQGEVSELIFDEIGIYSAGRPAVATSGISSIDVGVNKRSTSEVITQGAVPSLTANTTYALRVTIDGIQRDGVIRTGNTGSGSGGVFTYGDICEGINLYSSILKFALLNVLR